MNRLITKNKIPQLDKIIFDMILLLFDILLKLFTLYNIMNVTDVDFNNFLFYYSFESMSNNYRKYRIV